MDTDKLYEGLASESYKAFSEKLSKDGRYPTKGVKIPVLRKIAKEIGDCSFPIKYHEDVILRALQIGGWKKPFREKAESLDELFPYMSAWDHSDAAGSSLKIGKGEQEETLAYFLALLSDERTFAKRTAIVFLMSNRKRYDRKVLLDAITAADSDDYYISMAVAWALSFFYIDDKSTEEYFDKVSEATRKRTKQKIKDSRRC